MGMSGLNSKKSKLIKDEYVNKVMLKSLIPVIYNTINTLGLRFIF